MPFTAPRLAALPDSVLHSIFHTLACSSTERATAMDSFSSLASTCSRLFSISRTPLVARARFVKVFGSHRALLHAVRWYEKRHRPSTKVTMGLDWWCAFVGLAVVERRTGKELSLQQLFASSSTVPECTLSTRIPLPRAVIQTVDFEQKRRKALGGPVYPLPSASVFVDVQQTVTVTDVVVRISQHVYGGLLPLDYSDVWRVHDVVNQLTSSKFATFDYLHFSSTESADFTLTTTTPTQDLDDAQTESVGNLAYLCAKQATDLHRTLHTHLREFAFPVQMLHPFTQRQLLAAAWWRFLISVDHEYAYGDDEGIPCAECVQALISNGANLQLLNTPRARPSAYTTPSSWSLSWIPLPTWLVGRPTALIDPPSLLIDTDPFIFDIVNNLPVTPTTYPTPYSPVDARACWNYTRQRAVPFALWLHDRGTNVHFVHLTTRLIAWAAVGGGLEKDDTWDMRAGSDAVKWLLKELLGNPNLKAPIAAKQLLGFLHPTAITAGPLRPEHMASLAPLWSWVDGEDALSVLEATKGAVGFRARLVHQAGFLRHVLGTDPDTMSLEVLLGVRNAILRRKIIGAASPSTPHKLRERSPTLPGSLPGCFMNINM
ncbi:hypothetical protein M427DRAFT_45665 [Gonapodya prolifera JEL478]|uniref:F-box domain-containing protein n=1 Tax=Gonapodya prolifera (strain JEL478) TaxID=1344416 RepID=A0A139AA26_GONPJ|nr:hypothetical protein M427DRAFT_45665 [Gonapodya prolifera JEL478]|eukprot:KXS13548.1 hypothetical protein M427DRAFT_45665 [Gonapodya prolifera JEL478]